jgi:hypothetical protein
MDVVMKFIANEKDAESHKEMANSLGEQVLRGAEHMALAGEDAVVPNPLYDINDFVVEYSRVYTLLWEQLEKQRFVSVKDAASYAACLGIMSLCKPSVQKAIRAKMQFAIEFNNKCDEPDDDAA